MLKRIPRTLAGVTYQGDSNTQVLDTEVLGPGIKYWDETGPSDDCISLRHGSVRPSSSYESAVVSDRLPDLSRDRTFRRSSHDIFAGHVTGSDLQIARLYIG